MASRAEGRSLSEMERETEHTRADLIHTVDELHSRVSPQAIKEEVKAYTRDTGNELIHPRTEGPRESTTDGCCCGWVSVPGMALLDQYSRPRSIGWGRLGPYAIRRIISCTYQWAKPPKRRRATRRATARRPAANSAKCLVQFIAGS